MPAIEKVISTKANARFDGTTWTIREIKLLPWSDFVDAEITPELLYQVAESTAYTPAIGAQYSATLPAVTLKEKNFRFTGTLDDGTLEVELLYQGVAADAGELRYGASTTQIQTTRDINDNEIITTKSGEPQLHYVAVMDPLQTIRVTSAFTLNNAPTVGAGWQHPQKIQDTYHRTLNSSSLPSFTVQDTVGQFLISRIEIRDIQNEPFLAPNGFTFTATFEIQRKRDGWKNTSTHEEPDRWGNVRAIENPIINAPDDVQLVESVHYLQTDWSPLPFWNSL